MTRSELISKLGTLHLHLAARDIEWAVRIIIDGLSTTMAQGGRVEIRGFGSFSLNYRPPRKGRNPKTGAAVEITARNMPHFKTGKELRERVNFLK